jgi:hypothetical protein
MNFSGEVTERRIAWLTLIFGAAASLAAVFLNDMNWAMGLAIGAVLAWLNFRWMQRSVNAMVAAAEAQAGVEKPSLPSSGLGTAMFRYVLMGLSIYVIFKLLKIPLASMFVGLCALGAAAVAASVYEIVHPVKSRQF